MAQQQQAARLASRMQRELKMLTSDPPPGVCAWPLHHHLLTHLQAQIQGPQGTAYDGGIFKLDIEVPDRYPFEPPSIRFMTPVYHPNVDNGGRICLDILNLPPKGAWRPSLNLSTLLASIGLLLAEPNPDDGLMVDITAEYKHDKVTFDAKARKWTELYAIHDELKQKETLNGIQLTESLQEKRISLKEPTKSERKDNTKKNVIQDQENGLIENSINGTFCPRKKLSLQGDSRDEIPLIPLKRNDYLDKKKLSLQPDPKVEISFLSSKMNDDQDKKKLSLHLDSKEVTFSVPCINNDNLEKKNPQERKKMTRSEKENNCPNDLFESKSLVGKTNSVNTTHVCDDNVVISGPQVMETFCERMPIITKDAPSRSKSLKLSRTRLDMHASRMQQINIAQRSEKASQYPEKASHCSEKAGLHSEINCHVIVTDVPMVSLDNGRESGIDSSKIEQMKSKDAKERSYSADVPLVIVSDSGSDDELSDEKFTLSLTQRSFMHKRKAKSKIR